VNLGAGSAAASRVEQLATAHAPQRATASSPCHNLHVPTTGHSPRPALVDRRGVAPYSLKRPLPGPSPRGSGGRYARWARIPDARPADSAHSCNAVRIHPTTVDTL
jgi:hypothetical protein